MRVKPVVFSVGVAILIVVILVFSIFGILYFYWGDTTAVKDSLSTIAGFFGGFATLGAAIIAAYLFNDWRDQHNKTVENELAWAVIHKFDIAEMKASQFQDVFQDFKYKCQFLYEMPDEEFQNLNNELNDILNPLKEDSLKFSSFLESTRKYSLVAKKTYFNDITNDVQQINRIIFNTKSHKAYFPNSMNAIEDTIKSLGVHIKNIEEKCINNILTELKTPT